jgi:hypothetical protein
MIKYIINEWKPSQEELESTVSRACVRTYYNGDSNERNASIHEHGGATCWHWYVVIRQPWARCHTTRWYSLAISSSVSAIPKAPALQKRRTQKRTKTDNFLVTVAAA